MGNMLLNGKKLLGDNPIIAKGYLASSSSKVSVKILIFFSSRCVDAINTDYCNHFSKHKGKYRKNIQKLTPQITSPFNFFTIT